MGTTTICGQCGTQVARGDVTCGKCGFIAPASDDAGDDYLPEDTADVADPYPEAPTSGRRKLSRGLIGGFVVVCSVISGVFAVWTGQQARKTCLSVCGVEASRCEVRSARSRTSEVAKLECSVKEQTCTQACSDIGILSELWENRSQTQRLEAANCGAQCDAELSQCFQSHDVDDSLKCLDKYSTCLKACP